MNHSTAFLILAAGKGKRMNNPDMAKVMYPLGGIPLIEHVIRLADSCGASRIVVVVGHQRQSVIDHCTRLGPHISFAVQEEQLGTGHAVLQAEKALSGFHGDVVILSGDVPLTRIDTLQAMLARHRESKAAVTVMTAHMPDPAGYGRVIRNGDGRIVSIVEHKDATPGQLAIDEINSGIYVFDSDSLFEALKHVGNNNAQGEYYLPDVFGIFAGEHRIMEPFVVNDLHEIQGINTIEQLREMEEYYSMINKV
jgi:UDP-N-acetylglucosamine diphosphorylase/glucosamine-1-phosphate N-acetyltransferase